MLSIQGVQKERKNILSKSNKKQQYQGIIGKGGDKNITIHKKNMDKMKFAKN